MARIFDPGTFTVKEQKTLGAYPVQGMLYRHAHHHAIFRCIEIIHTDRRQSCVLEFVWCMPGFNFRDVSQNYFTLTGDPRRISVTIVDKRLPNWHHLDVAWFGRTWRELTDLIQSEFGDNVE